MNMIAMGIIGIIAFNLIFFFIVQNTKTDKGLKNYLRKNHRE
jgi:uncharacterized integral membrane protein